MSDDELKRLDLYLEGLPTQTVGPITRLLLLAVGWVFVGLGLLGVILPVLPTTPFLLISVWAFSKSSPRLHRWLYTHPMAGPYLVSWSLYHVIPVKAKALAVALMVASWSYLTFFVATSWVLPTVVGFILLCAMAYILTQPSLPPEGAAVARSREKFLAKGQEPAKEEV